MIVSTNEKSNLTQNTPQAFSDTYASWLSQYVVNRRDCYNLDNRFYVKHKDAFVPLTMEVLKAHASGHISIAIPATSDPRTQAANLCRWIMIDIDNKQASVDSTTNREYALKIHAALETLGLEVILEDSNGTGGIHLWVLFSRLPSQTAYAFARWIVNELVPWQDNVDGEPECNPKQAELTATRLYGNPCRLPGRHPKRNYYSRLYFYDQWNNWSESLEWLTSRTPNEPHLIPAEAQKYIPPKYALGKVWDGFDYDGSADYLRSYDGDLRTLDLHQLLIDRELLHRSKSENDYTIWCPWHNEHSQGTDPFAGVAIGESGYPMFHCFHAHCEQRTTAEFLAWFGKDTIDQYCRERFSADPFYDVDAVSAACVYSPHADVEIVDAGTDGELEPRPQNEPQDNEPNEPHAETPPVEPQDAIRDVRTAYLWEGNHGRYLTPEKRQQRINSIAETWKYIPDGLIGEYVKWQLPTTDASPLFLMGAGLSLAGHILNRKVSISMGGKSVHANVWLALIAGSTLARKSSSIYGVKKVLRELRDYRDTLLANDMTQEKFIDCLGYHIPSKEETDDALYSLEQECELAFNTKREYTKGVGLWHIDELGAWLGNIEKYNGGGKGLLTDLWDDKPNHIRRTKVQGTSYIYKPCITLVGASTLSWLSDNLTESDLGSGFLPRWLFLTAGEPDYHLVIQDDPSEEQTAKVMAMATALQNVKGKTDLTKAAKDYVWQWGEQFRITAPNRMSGWTGRLEVYLRKIAMIYEATRAAADYTGDEPLVMPPIQLDTIERAALFINRCRDGIAQLLDRDLGFTETDRNQKRVLQVLRKLGGTAIHRDVQHYVSHSMDAKTLRDTIATLAGAGHITVTQVSRRGQTALQYGIVSGGG